MAEGKICVCPQCGKKFKLKADFASASFACTQCSATVWLDGKPKGPSGTRRKAAGSRSPQSGRKKTATKRSAGGRGSRAASGAGASAGTSAGRGRRGRREEPEEQEEQRERGSRYQEKNNSQNVIVAVVGLVLVVGIIAFLLMKGGDDKKTPDDTNAKIDTSLNDVTDDTEGTESATPPEDEDTSEGTDTPPEDREPAVTETAPDGSGESGVEPKKKLTKSKPKKKKKGIRKSRWNPPEDIGHLEDTPADKQKEIDELVTLVFDHWAGRRSLDAKQKLAVIGKPAYLPLLAAIRGAKKNIKWDNNDDDNLVLSSVKLADECLRLMDGYLEANGVSVIRPGTPEKYFDFVVRMHYKRWMKKLVSMDAMPGPFDPSSEYEKETEESE